MKKLKINTNTTTPSPVNFPRPQASIPRPDHSAATRKSKSMRDLLASGNSTDVPPAFLELPSQFDWTSTEDVATALHTLLPGRRYTSEVKALIAFRSQSSSDQLRLPDVTDDQMSCLLDSINLIRSPSIVDFTSGHSPIHSLVTRSIQSSQCTTGYMPFTAEAYPCDPMQPSTYRCFHNEHGAHLIIVSLTPAVADAIIPLASMHARHAACFLVTPSFFSQNSSVPLRTFLRGLLAEGRVHVIHHQPSSSLWLLIFSSTLTMSTMLDSGHADLEISAHWPSSMH